MTKPPHRYWNEMTTEDFSALDLRRVIAVLPVGATEQHGPHLPVHTDCCINEGVLSRALDLLPADLQVTALPMISIGKSSEHTAFPGTLTLTTETLIRVLMEIGESVNRSGVRKLVLFNSHGGQPQILDIVARDLRVSFGMLVAAVNAGRLLESGGLFSDSEMKHGIHAGAKETSLMLHLRPDSVRREKSRRFETLSEEMEARYRFLSPEGRVGFGWQVQDLNPAGVCGDATDADAERGGKMVEEMAGNLVEVLKEVDRLPIDILKDRP